MRQIARCPACATMFRITAEQLEMAHGWARCGQCGEVFDAGLHLLANHAALAGKSAPVQALNTCIEPPFVDRTSDLTPVSDMEPQDLLARPNDAALSATPVAPPEMPTSAKTESEALPEIDFVRETHRLDFWKLPLVRGALSLVCLALLAALLVQLAIGQKDVLAAQEPRLAPLLQATCQVLGCEVLPLRRIESLVIDQASFRKTGLDTYRLAFVFRNTGDAGVEVPALEVTLTDSQDQAVVRRVVLPAQFAAGTVTLAAHAELAGTLLLKVAGAERQAAPTPAQAGLPPVASYRILAFYP